MVIVVIGILAASAIPAISLIQDTKTASAAREIERLLVVARERALGVGQPHGLNFDLGAQSIEPVTIATLNASPERAIGPDGQEAEAFLASRFGSARVLGLIGGDGASGSGAIWFSHDGTPEVRDGSGRLSGAFTRDAEVEVGDGTGSPTVVYVRRISGLIER